MSSHIFRASMFIALMVFLFAIVAPVQAAGPTAAVCESQTGNAFGLCRAAVSSGCATDGRNMGSTHCVKLGSNFTRLTGQSPIWLAPTRLPPRRGDFGGS